MPRWWRGQSLQTVNLPSERATPVQILPSALMDNLTKIRNIPLVKSVELNSPITAGTVFFGVGIMTSKKLGVELPFDILGMFFASEIIRRQLNLQTVFVVLGDNHAKSNQLVDTTEINLFSKRVESKLIKIIHNFTLTNFRILRASTFHQEKSFQEILTRLPQMENEYLRLEIADCLFLKHSHNLQIKIGWTMSKEENICGNDERFFDRAISEFVPDLSFVHLEPGWTFDIARPRVSPYISVAGEKRLVLKEDQDFPSLGACTGHLSKIVRAAEILWGKLPFGMLNKKVEFLLNKAIL